MEAQWGNRAEWQAMFAASSAGRLRGASMAFQNALREAWPDLAAGRVDAVALGRVQDAGRVLEMVAGDVLGERSPFNRGARAEAAFHPPLVF